MLELFEKWYKIKSNLKFRNKIHILIEMFNYIKIFGRLGGLPRQWRSQYTGLKGLEPPTPEIFLKYYT